MTAGVPAKLLVTITSATAAFRVAVVTVVAFRIAASCPPQIQPKERLASSSRPIPVQPLSRIPARVFILRGDDQPDQSEEEDIRQNASRFRNPLGQPGRA